MLSASGPGKPAGAPAGACAERNASLNFGSTGIAVSPSDGPPSKHCATLDESRRLRMDGSPQSITPHDLYARLATAAAPLLFDVRRPESFAAGDLIVGAISRSPADVIRGMIELPLRASRRGQLQSWQGAEPGCRWCTPRRWHRQARPTSGADPLRLPPEATPSIPITRNERN